MFKLNKLLARFMLLGILSLSLVMIFVGQVKASGVSNYMCSSVCRERSPGVYEVCDEEVRWVGWSYTCSTDESLCEVVTGCNFDPDNGNNPSGHYIY